MVLELKVLTLVVASKTLHRSIRILRWKIRVQKYQLNGTKEEVMPGRSHWFEYTVSPHFCPNSYQPAFISQDRPPPWSSKDSAKLQFRMPTESAIFYPLPSRSSDSARALSPAKLIYFEVNEALRIGGSRGWSGLLKLARIGGLFPNLLRVFVSHKLLPTKTADVITKWWKGGVNLIPLLRTLNNFVTSSKLVPFAASDFNDHPYWIKAGL